MQITCESATDQRDALRILQTFDIDYQAGINAGGKMYFDIDESGMSRTLRDNLIESLTSQTCVDVIGEAGEIDEDDLIVDREDDSDDDDDDDDEESNDEADNADADPNTSDDDE